MGNDSIAEATQGAAGNSVQTPKASLLVSAADECVVDLE